MKKLTQVLLIAGLILAGQCFVYGQPGKIALHHNGTMSIFTDLKFALITSENGDTLYLPGGTVYNSISTVIIDKKLTIIGAGHYPDSTYATYQTNIISDIYIVTGAEGGLLSGIRCNNVAFGTSQNDQNVNNYRITRCFINVFSPSYSGQSSSQNILISENVIRSFYVLQSNGFSSVLFEKNIFDDFNNYSYSATFNNCVFGIGSYSFASGSGPCIFNNSIIIYQGNNNYFYLGSPSTLFNNTLVTNVYSSPYVYTAGTVNNLLPIEASTSTFINLITPPFSYTNNYHLNPSSNGHNAGTDGTDIGIYGTLTPYKEAAVPFNPHISSKSIGTATSPTGTLSVDVKVVAQDR